MANLLVFNCDKEIFCDEHNYDVQCVLDRLSSPINKFVGNGYVLKILSVTKLNFCFM